MTPWEGIISMFLVMYLHVINKHAWANLDPGGRTFQTIYCPTTGVAYKIGQGDIARIYRLCLILDQLISKQKTMVRSKDNIKGQTNRQSLQKMIKKLRLKIKHLIDEVHWKTIQFLLTHFENIVIPIFGVQKMINHKTRKISKQSVRQLLGWRHYTFRQRLISSSKRTSTKIHVVGEEYTTQTCGSCLKLYKNVGGRKIYQCPSCGVRIDRDLNGSRNIFLMNCVLSDETDTQPIELVEGTLNQFEVIDDVDIMSDDITDMTIENETSSSSEETIVDISIGGFLPADNATLLPCGQCSNMLVKHLDSK